jgi:type I restriction enzyme M protein
MTSTQQRAALQRQIWAIANDVRGSVDGWDFKQYVLGTLFYRFISENFALYIEADDDSINYAKLSDEVITPDIKDDAIKTKGYFIYPSQLFANVAKNANSNESLNTDLAAIFAAIEASASGYPSEGDIKGLFADFDTTSNRLGNTVKDKNLRLAAVLKGVAGLDFGHDFYEKSDAAQIDLFGDAYEYLISNYAANAGKSGGEFFTPQHVSRLIAQLAMHKQTSVNKIYDPAAGSGSLLLQAKKHFDNHIIEEGFFGQEINHTTYNLARMNMFLHNINYDKFNMQLGNTLTDPHFGDDKPFDAIVSNPPYSVKWIGSDDPTLINDDRFAPAGVLAPKSKADFAFVLHALSYLSSKGRAAIVCFPGIFYRGGAEQKIRQYLVDNNYVETVISLAPNLFFGTTIAVTILVLSKHKTDTTTQFIDASGLFKKDTNTNTMTGDHIQQIMEVFDSKANVEHFAKSIPFEKVSANDYNLSVSSYVEAKDNREVTDITELNAEIKITVARIDQLRADIDVIVAEIEGGESEGEELEA